MIITTPNGITINGSKEELAEIVHSIVAGKNSISIPVAKSSKSKKIVAKKVVKRVSKPAFKAGENLGFDINEVKKHFKNYKLRSNGKTVRREYTYFRQHGKYSWETTHTNDEINQIRQANRKLLKETFGVTNMSKAPREFQNERDRHYRELCKTLNGADLHYAIAAFTNNLLDFRKKQKNRPKGIGADHVVAAKENGSL
jgi:hypothetical protein